MFYFVKFVVHLTKIWLITNIDIGRYSECTLEASVICLALPLAFPP